MKLGRLLHPMDRRYEARTISWRYAFGMCRFDWINWRRALVMAWRMGRRRYHPMEMSELPCPGPQHISFLSFGTEGNPCPSERRFTKIIQITNRASLFLSLFSLSCYSFFQHSNIPVVISLLFNSPFSPPHSSLKSR